MRYILLLLFLLQPTLPPTLTVYGCGVNVCAFVRHADTVSTDAPYTEEALDSARLLVFSGVPSFIEARGPGGVTRWPDATAPTPLPTRTPAPFVARAYLGVVLDGVSIP